MKIEYKEGLIVLKDQDEEVGYIKYVRKEEMWLMLFQQLFMKISRSRDGRKAFWCFDGLCKRQFFENNSIL